MAEHKDTPSQTVRQFHEEMIAYHLAEAKKWQERLARVPEAVREVGAYDTLEILRLSQKVS